MRKLLAVLMMVAITLPLMIFPGSVKADEKTIDLEDLVPVTTHQYESAMKDWAFLTYGGVKYTHNMMQFEGGSTEKDRESYGVYDLDGKYTSFKGVVCPRDISVFSPIDFTIFADGECIYSVRFSDVKQLEHFDVDVTGVKELKLMTVNEDLKYRWNTLFLLGAYFTVADNPSPVSDDRTALFDLEMTSSRKYPRRFDGLLPIPDAFWNFHIVDAVLKPDKADISYNVKGFGETTASIFVTSTNPKDKATVSVYLDDKLVETYPDLTIKSEVQKLNVNVAGAKRLKFVVSKPYGENDLKIYIGDSNLKKDPNAPAINPNVTKINLIDMTVVKRNQFESAMRDWSALTYGGIRYTSNMMQFEGGSTEKHRESYGIYNLDGKYTTFKGVVCPRDISAFNPIDFTIFADGKCIYSMRFSEVQQIESFEVDVTGVKELKLMTINEDFRSHWNTLFLLGAYLTEADTPSPVSDDRIALFDLDVKSSNGDPRIFDGLVPLPDSSWNFHISEVRLQKNQSNICYDVTNYGEIEANVFVTSSSSSDITGKVTLNVYLDDVLVKTFSDLTINSEVQKLKLDASNDMNLKFEIVKSKDNYLGIVIADSNLKMSDKPATPKPTPTPTEAKPTTAPTATPNKPTTESGVEGFVDRLYTVAMDRDSDEAGKEYWSNEVKVNGKTGADLAVAFLLSDEFLGKKMSNDQFLEVLYKTFFDREGDDAGKKYWNDEMTNGGKSKVDVIYGFINSPEWANICLTYGIKSGTDVQPTITIKPNAEVTAFAERLYTTCLGRDSEEAGLKYWADELANLRQSGSQVAKGFFFSPEFVNSKLDDSEYLTRLYKTVMGREPEKAGFDYWLGEMKAGRMSREGVFDGFAASPEWIGICADYGILR